MKDFFRRHASILTLLPVLALMGMIFVFSSQPAELSNQTSGGIVQLILDLFFPGFEKYDPARQAQITETVVLFVRKGAHFTEYALLGLALLVHIMVWRKRRRISRPCPLALGIGALYAASDELHQVFVPGRSGELSDVLLDCAGVASGIVLLWLLMRKRKSRGAPDPQ